MVHTGLYREKPISPAQLKVLHNLCVGQSTDVGISGGSDHGAHGQVLRSIVRRGWTKKGESMWDLKIRRAGVVEHRAKCCKRGITEDDILVEEVEAALEGKKEDELRPLRKMTSIGR